MNVSLKHTLNLKLKKVRHFFGNHEFTIMPWINNKHMSSLFLFSFSLCSGVAVDRHWTVLHEHQPWGLYWICQVSYSFPVTIQNIDADVGIYLTYSSVHVPLEVKPYCFVPMCVVCSAQQRINQMNKKKTAGNQVLWSQMHRRVHSKTVSVISLVTARSCDFT